MVFTRQRQPHELCLLSASGAPYSSPRAIEHTVDLHLAVSHHLLDLSLLLQVLQAPPCEGAVDLESVDEGGDRHKAVGLDIFIELVGSGLVKDDGVLGLVLDCSEAQQLAVVARAVSTAMCQEFVGAESRLPFPLDHFFFCFLAPAAAGAILDVCSGGLMKVESVVELLQAGRFF